MKKRDSWQSRPGEKIVRLSEDLLWGVHPVFEGLEKDPGRFAEIILQKGKRGGKIDNIIDMARLANIKLDFVQSLRITGPGNEQVRHQGVLARTNETSFVPFDDLVCKMKDRLSRGENARLVVCDSLLDPRNLGAIIRSAVATGALGVLVTRNRSAPIGGTVAKASAGAIAHIDICQVTNLVRALQELKDVGFWVLGAVNDANAQSLYDTELMMPFCLVVGNEANGVRPLVRRECDILVSIPMVGNLDSLNSSVAAAVILFEAMRQSEVGGKKIC